MTKGIIIHKGEDQLGFVCRSCYDSSAHKKFAECEFSTNPNKCESCGKWIGWEEDRKATPVSFRAVRLDDT